MKLYYAVFLCCWLRIQRTSATCTNPPAMTNFNETWFISRIPWFVDSTQGSTTDTCRKLVFTQGTGMMNLDYTSGTVSATTTIQCTWTPVSGSPGKYDQRCPVSSTNPDILSILGTDYVKYLVTYRCLTVGASSIDFYELWSPDPTIYNAYTSQGSLIPTSIVLNKITQNNLCPNTNGTPNGSRVNFAAKFKSLFSG